MSRSGSEVVADEITNERFHSVLIHVEVFDACERGLVWSNSQSGVHYSLSDIHTLN